MLDFAFMISRIRLFDQIHSDRLQVLDKSAVARMASIIQVNVKKETPACADDSSSTARHGTFPESNGNDEKESIPMAAASIETWGGLAMRCSEAGSSVHASDFGYTFAFFIFTYSLKLAATSQI